jgi:hypothetical protein
MLAYYNGGFFVVLPKIFKINIFVAGVSLYTLYDVALTGFAFSSSYSSCRDVLHLPY